MWDALEYYYSSRGPLGAWTPILAVLLNFLGVALALLLVKLVTIFFKPTYDLRKIPSPPVGDPILGHVKYLLRPDYHRVILDWTRKYGSIFRLRILTDWTVVITDPAAAAHVLATVPGRTANYTLVDEVLGGPGRISMFGTRDEAHWRNVRKTTAPAFSPANVRRYFGGVLASAGELLTSLEQDQALRGYVDAEPHLQRMMLRATLQGLFEVPDASHLPGFDQLAPRILMLMAESNRQITDPLRAAWYRTPLAPLLSKHFAECRRAAREVVAFHRATAARLLARPVPDPENSLLWACLHRLRHPATGRKLTAVELHPEVGMYTTAGFDTTSSTVGWCLYAAALHPEQQERVAAELRSAGVFKGGAVVEEEAAEEEEQGGEGAGQVPRLSLDPRGCPGPDELARLPLLNAFINEAMRLYPTTAVSAERTHAQRPVTVGGLTLPAGVVLWPLVYGIHMSERNWDDPEQFRMDRWVDDPRCALARLPTTEEAKQQPGPGGEEVANVRRFMPFGEGPKNCVGQNFGAAVVRAVVALLLSRYRVALHPDMGLGPDPGGLSSAQLAEHTAALTLVAVVTKLRKLRVVLSRRGPTEG